MEDAGQGKCGVNRCVLCKLQLAGVKHTTKSKTYRLLCSALVELSVSEDPPMLNQTDYVFCPIGAVCSASCPLRMRGYAASGK